MLIFIILLDVSILAQRVDHNVLNAGVETHRTLEITDVLFLKRIKTHLNVVYSSKVLVISEGVPLGFFNF